ncbi:MAG: type II toxin-antitoxin system RelE/ParE family toxin [Planctomycetota bacterium]
MEYSPTAGDHLKCLRKRDQVCILDAVDDRLIFQPDVETRNRKRMRPNPVAPWELRIGALRVYYDVETEPMRRVCIRAVGLKIRGKIVIGGKEIAL